VINAAIGRFDKLHAEILERAMKLIHEFVSVSGQPSLTELVNTSRSRLESFATMLLSTVPPAGFPQEAQRFRHQYAAVFQQRLNRMLKDIEFGFIGGRSMGTDSENSQSRALRLLKIIYDRTRDQADPVFVEDLAQGANLTKEESQAAWRYLKDSGLIQTFKIPGAARINAAGINAIEDAQRHPDQPIHGFPSITYNIVNNTANIGTAINSPVQQAGAQSMQRGRPVGRAFTTDTAEHIREALPVLKPIIAWTGALGALFVIAGGVFLILGASGYSEITFFGSSIKSSHVGVACAFLGAAVIVLSFRRVLTSLERLGKM